MKQILILAFSLLLVIVACNSNYKKVSNTQTTLPTSDTSRYVILHLQNAPTKRFDTSLKEAELSNPEINETFRLLSKSIQEYNSSNKQSIDFDKSPYKLQLIAVINSNNEKQVWINGFCHHPHFSNWRKEIVWVYDGGRCFFGVTINLTKKEFGKIITNGEA